ncbi:helix-turn-helix domain-containing protein (plasmid) [Streptomyces sp. WAC00276]|uniref:helix-turn-helix domain-containing protein n=1 Tax=Streptomyces sp. WAC00276 TaxID=2933778 RepID=UPI001FFECE64|nr:helix-turn-helix transcriptional regulator [Streptomyces sp. WAC00276]MCK2145350.1 helix-turn-helix domain-containing protein [Streptomyces sp. WAC00276]
MTSPLHRDPRPPFADLAEHLVALRGAARLSQRGLAAAAAVSRGTVQRAESGTAAPSAAVLDALVRACGGDQSALDHAYTLRARGRTEHRGRLRGLAAPSPALIRTPGDLGATLAAQYEQAGAPPLSDLVRPSGGRTRIPRTTAWRIIRRRGLPASPEQLQTFLDVCRVRRSAQRHFHEAFERVRDARGARPAPPQHTLRTAPVTARGRGAEKITPWFRDLMDTMSPEQIETVLTVGTAYLLAGEAHRNGTAPPRSLDRVLRAADQLFSETNRRRGPDFAFLGPHGDPVLVEAKYYRGAPQGARHPSNPKTSKPLSRPATAWEWKSARSPHGPHTE